MLRMRREILFFLLSLLAGFVLATGCGRATPTVINDPVDPCQQLQ